jgi:hypothetical protein
VESVADIVTLRVPRDLGSLSVIRVVLDGVALRRDLPIDALDDLKLAVEAIIAQETMDGERLTLEFAVGPGSLSVVVDGLRNESLKEDLLATVSAQPRKSCFLDMKVVLGSLVDDYRVVERDPGSFGVQMKKRFL